MSQGDLPKKKGVMTTVWTGTLNETKYFFVPFFTTHVKDSFLKFSVTYKGDMDKRETTV